MLMFSPHLGHQPTCVWMTEVFHIGSVLWLESRGVLRRQYIETTQLEISLRIVPHLPACFCQALCMHINALAKFAKISEVLLRGIEETALTYPRAKPMGGDWQWGFPSNCLSSPRSGTCRKVSVPPSLYSSLPSFPLPSPLSPISSITVTSLVCAFFLQILSQGFRFSLQPLKPFIPPWTTDKQFSGRGWPYYVRNFYLSF